MELKCFRAFLNKSLYTLLFLFISLPIRADILDNLIGNNLVENNNQLKPKELYIKYIKYPKTIYTNQRFGIKLEARILVPQYDYNFIETTYNGENNIDILNHKIAWTKEDNNRYTTTINYKVKDENFTLPTIKLSLYKNNEVVNSIKIDPPKIVYNKIAINQQRFSNIIAHDLKVKSIQTKQYNNTSLMVICHMEAINGNLEEFYLKQFQEQGINYFTQQYAKQSIYYYMIIPSHINNIKFNYYNPTKAKFIELELPIILEDELVSTQTNLNPNDGNLLYYKRMASLIMIAIFLLFYMKMKNKIFIVLAFVFIAIFIKLILPNEKMIIKENTKVYILPTKLSTVYKVIDKQNEVEILSEQNSFIKVLFKNKNIGWIKKNDIKQN